MIGAGLLTADDFQAAYERARKRFGEEAWQQLSTHDQSDAIYEELRALDAERVEREAALRHPTSGGSDPS
jgi:hypothetical protein